MQNTLAPPASSSSHIEPILLGALAATARATARATQTRAPCTPGDDLRATRAVRTICINDDALLPITIVCLSVLLSTVYCGALAHRRRSADAAHSICRFVDHHNEPTRRPLCRRRRRRHVTTHHTSFGVMHVLCLCFGRIACLIGCKRLSCSRLFTLLLFWRGIWNRLRWMDF